MTERLEQSNTNLSKLNMTELHQFLNYASKYKLILREKTNIPSDATFGFELEFFKKNLTQIRNKLNSSKFSKWHLCSDDAIREIYEIQTPILTDTIESWLELEEMCETVGLDNIVNTNCGAHIHVGAQVLGPNPKAWLNYLLLISTYENIIFRFGYGEDSKPRKYLEGYASSVSKDFWNRYQELKGSFYYEVIDVIKGLNIEKFKAINFVNVKNTKKVAYKNTIEIRHPNGTKNPIIWQNNNLLTLRTILYAKNTEFDQETILRRKRINERLGITFEHYSDFQLDAALEFADLIFTNDLDKIYFLNQYIKPKKKLNEGKVKSKTFSKWLTFFINWLILF